MLQDKSEQSGFWVELYTINAAYAMRQEHVVGSLATGKDADFIVIDTDIDKTTRMSFIKLEFSKLFWTEKRFIGWKTRIW